MDPDMVAFRPGMDYGVGVDTPRGQACNVAVTGTPTVIPGASGSIIQYSMTEITSIEDLNKQLNISASAGGGIGLFSGSARMDYANSIKFNASSVFVMVSVEVLQAFEQIKEPGITAAAADLLANGHTDLFKQQYGDMFVRGFQTGGVFWGTIEIITNGTDDAHEVHLSANASYGVGNFGAHGNVDFDQSFHDTLTSHQKVVKCHIEGGKVDALPTIVDDLIQSAKTWPSTVSNNAVPYQALLASYSILPIPNPPTYIDLQHQKDILAQCAQLRDMALQTINDVDYILQYPDQFIGADSTVLTQIRNDLNTNRAFA